jgi:cell shape-determining protein MreC
VDERRTAGLLILLVVGQLALLGLQIPAESGSGTLLGSLGLRVLAPLARGVENVGDGLSGVGQDLRLKGTVLAENRRLEREIERLRLELLRFREVRGEAQRLAKALRYEAPPLGSLRVADVVYLDDSALSTTLVVYVGQTPTFRNQTVLAARGLVGRVIN